MTRHFEKEVEKLKKHLLSLCTVVEESVFNAGQAIMTRDAVLAKKVIDADSKIDEMEVEIEEECLKILALHQPVAIDLRFVVIVLKINNDLERIGDLAANVASRVTKLAALGNIDIPFDFREITEKTRSMLRMSIDSLVKMDVKLAHQVCLDDDQVDKLNSDIYMESQNRLPKEPENAEMYILLLSASRNLERIADLATNIAEDVIYMISGEIVRHQLAEHE